MNIPLVSFCISVVILLAFIAGTLYGKYKLNQMTVTAWVYKQCLGTALAELEASNENKANRIILNTQEKLHTIGDKVNVKLGDDAVVQTEVITVYKKDDVWYTTYEILDIVLV